MSLQEQQFMEAQRRQNALARLQRIQKDWAKYPGSAPNGTGLTGLDKWDAKGYSDLLNRQTEGLNLQRELKGEGPMTVEAGGEMGGLPVSLGDMPEWWQLGSPMATNLPPSLQGLRKATKGRK